MFGRRKKELMARMEMLVAAAQFITCTAICEKNGACDEAAGQAEQARLGAIGAAEANYLFAREPDARHAAMFHLGELNAEADAWLSQNPKFQELVVQSLRVLNTISFGRSGGADDQVGEALLQRYGKEFPAAPDPTRYPNLVKRSLNELSAANKRSLVNAFARRGLRF